MKRLLLFLSFVLGNFTILFVALLALTIYTTRESTASPAEPIENLQLMNESYENYTAAPSLPPIQSHSIIAGDARPIIVDNFFSRYRSPMVGLGKDIVQAADKYQIPFGYLPAIAQCEGLLGKAIPKESFNTWGWGIYGDMITRFSSWQEGIETVASGLRRDYFNLGLDTPEEIMAKYTPPSQGSWAYCVNKFLGEIK